MYGDIMSEVEMLGLAGVGVIAVFLVVRAVLSKRQDTDESDLVSVDGEGSAE